MKNVGPDNLEYLKKLAGQYQKQELMQPKRKKMRRRQILSQGRILRLLLRRKLRLKSFTVPSLFSMLLSYTL
jgi:cobalamin biosynthesis Mg chelatase CobN